MKSLKVARATFSISQSHNQLCLIWMFAECFEPASSYFPSQASSRSSQRLVVSELASGNGVKKSEKYFKISNEAIVLQANAHQRYSMKLESRNVVKSNLQIVCLLHSNSNSKHFIRLALQKSKKNYVYRGNNDKKQVALMNFQCFLICLCVLRIRTFSALLSRAALETLRESIPLIVLN